MSRTNIQLMGADITHELHTVFGSKEPTDYVEDLFFKKENIEGHLFKKEINKKYWIENLWTDNVIVNTALFAHGKLATDKNKSFRSNFNESDIQELVINIKKKYPEKTIDLILPRVETGVFEDHIVIEYRKITEKNIETLIIAHLPHQFKYNDSLPNAWLISNHFH